MHLADSSGGCGHNVGKARDDLGKRSLANDNQRTINDSDALSWCLERLALLCHHPDVGDNLSRRNLSGDRDRESHSGSKEVAE